MLWYLKRHSVTLLRLQLYSVNDRVGDIWLIKIINPNWIVDSGQSYLVQYAYGFTVYRVFIGLVCQYNMV